MLWRLIDPLLLVILYNLEPVVVAASVGGLFLIAILSFLMALVFRGFVKGVWHSLNPHLVNLLSSVLVFSIFLLGGFFVAREGHNLLRLFGVGLPLPFLLLEISGRLRESKFLSGSSVLLYLSLAINAFKIYRYFVPPLSNWCTYCFLLWEIPRSLCLGILVLLASLNLGLLLFWWRSKFSVASRWWIALAAASFASSGMVGIVCMYVDFFPPF